MELILLRRIALFLSIGLVLFVFINKLYEDTNYYRDMLSIEKFSRVPHRIELAIFGPSHGENAFYFENLDLTCFNFALKSQPYNYDLQLLKYYRKNINKKGIILLPVTYASFGKLSTERINAQKCRYYKILPPGYIIDFSMEDYIRYKLFPVLGAHQKIRYIFKDTNRSFDWYKRYNKHGLYIKEVALGRYKIFADFGGFTTESVKDLKSILTYAQTQGLRPVLVTTPITKELNNLYSQEFFDKFLQITKSIATEFDIPYLDYSRDNRFEENINLFMDSDHLNIRGATMFTHIVLKDLNNIYPDFHLE